MAPRVPSTPDADLAADADDPTDVSVSVVDEAPRLVDGRYRVVRQLGRGGMSVVYLAEHVDLRRPVALKILTPPLRSARGVDFAEWFRREARTLAQIQHPNVVTLHDFGRLGDDDFFLAMEFVPGPSLADLCRKGPLDPQHAARLMMQVCQALRHTHQRGVIHRDIKPNNLLLTLDSEGHELVKVIDFGIAQGGEEGSDADVLVGSPHCMSPEQIEGRQATPASDIYATGVVLYRALTARWPFHGATRRETLVAHLVGTIPRMAESAPDLAIPAQLEAVVRRCLAREPADRYPDADALLHDLAEFLHVDEASFDARSVRPEERATRATAPAQPPDGVRSAPAAGIPSGRVSVALAAGALALLALLLGALVALPRSAPAPASTGTADGAAPESTATRPVPAERPPAAENVDAGSGTETERPAAPAKARARDARPSLTPAPTPKAETPPKAATSPKAQAPPSAPDGYQSMPEF